MGWEDPRSTANSTTARIASRFEKPTTLSTGLSLRSQASTTGTFDSRSRWSVFVEWLVPTMKMPSGRRPRNAEMAGMMAATVMLRFDARFDAARLGT